MKPDGRLTLARWLFVGLTVLGIGCTGWALFNIWAQSVPAEVSSSPIPAPATVEAAQSTPTASVAVLKKAAPASTRGVRTIDFAKNPRQGDTLGVLSLPTLGQELPIIEGTRTGDLRKGVGHFVKSVLPGQPDNSVVSGHRDTYFSRLGELKKGDRVTVQTAAGTYDYQVKRIRIVGEHDRTVIVPTTHGVLTLTTCYPFDYVGSAPRRYIVSADLVASH